MAQKGPGKAHREGTSIMELAESNLEANMSACCGQNL